MLYVLLADGTIEELPQAETAELHDEEACLICYDDQGQEVARYAKLSVSMFSRKPFPTYINRDQSRK